jgi:hypothetical protein
MVEEKEVSPSKNYNQKCAFPYCRALALENVPLCDTSNFSNTPRFCAYHSRPTAPANNERQRFMSFVAWEHDRIASRQRGLLMPDITEYVAPPPPVVIIPKPKKIVLPTWAVAYWSKAPKGDAMHLRKAIRVKAANEEAAKLAFVAKRSKVKTNQPSTVADVFSVTPIERKHRTVKLKQDILDPFRRAELVTKAREFEYKQKMVASNTRDKSIGFDGRYTGPDSPGAGILKTEEGDE